MKKNILTLIFVHLFFLAFSQDMSNELKYEVNTVYPPLSITKEKLMNAQTLMDLNKHYSPSWVKKYNSVEILTIHQGNIKKAVSKNEILSPEQKTNLKMADVGTDISVKVQYLPENNLKQNELKEFDFTFMVNPDQEAQYIGGLPLLNQYLKEKAMDKIPAGSFKNYDLSAVKFTVSEEGEIINAHLFGSAYQAPGHETINQLLLETIRTMPCWKPAVYADGTKVKQEFVLTVGDQENCVINLLNIRPN